MVWKFSGWSGNFLNNLETFWIIWKLSRWSSNFPGDLETFRKIWKLSRWSGNFSDDLETFQMVWKLSRWSGNFPDDLETFRMVWKLSVWSGNFPNGLETFRIIWKLSRWSGNIPQFTSFWLRHFQHMHFEDKMLDQISLWRLPPCWVSLVQNLLERGASSFIGAWILLVQHLLRNFGIFYWCQNLIEFTKPVLLLVLHFHWCYIY